jgi:hypothetical protein
LKWDQLKEIAKQAAKRAANALPKMGSHGQLILQQEEFLQKSALLEIILLQVNLE